MSLSIVDAHCHLELAAFDVDRDAVIARAARAGVTRIHVPGMSPESWTRARTLVRHEALALGVGLHPWWVASVGDEALDAALARMHETARSLGARSISEIGLDRSGNRASSMARQERAFVSQLGLARALGLPVVLHVVGAHGRALELLRAHAPIPQGMVHGFTGATEVASQYVALGLSVSFGRALMHPRARRARASARTIPIERLLIETDAPDGGDARCEPAALVDVLSALAALRPEPEAELAASTATNATRLFFPA